MVLGCATEPVLEEAQRPVGAGEQPRSVLHATHPPSGVPPPQICRSPWPSETRSAVVFGPRSEPGLVLLLWTVSGHQNW